MNVTISRTEYVSQSWPEIISQTAKLDLPDRVEDDCTIVMHIVPGDIDRHSRLQRLAELASDESSLDWRLLARVNVAAWGSDAASE